MFMRETADRLFGKDYVWSVLAAGRHQMPFTTMAGILGGNVRVGLEDSLWIGKGVQAKSNAEQVTKIKRILEDLSLEIATPDEARADAGAEGRGPREVLTVTKPTRRRRGGSTAANGWGWPRPHPSPSQRIAAISTISAAGSPLTVPIAMTCPVAGSTRCSVPAGQQEADLPSLAVAEDVEGDTGRQPGRQLGLRLLHAIVRRRLQVPAARDRIQRVERRRLRARARCSYTRRR